jgi:hypothetical protein
MSPSDREVVRYVHFRAPLHTALVKSPKAFKTLHHSYFDSEFDILKPKKCENVRCCRRCNNLQLIYHLVKERGHWKVPNPSQRRKKKTDKFEIIRKLETIRTQLTNIKNQL